MALEGVCRIIVQDSPRPRKVLIYVPLEIARDSQFPYRSTDTAHIKVEPDGTITIRKMQHKGKAT
jgi:hypothetical protein